MERIACDCGADCGPDLRASHEALYWALGQAEEWVPVSNGRLAGEIRAALRGARGYIKEGGSDATKV